MRTTIIPLVPASLSLLLAGAIGCGDSSFANSSEPSADAETPDALDAPDAGRPIEAGVITGELPPNCDVKLTPSENACVVHDGVGIFVSASVGAVDGDGTRGRPLKSLQKAVEAAARLDKRVYACAETYAESISLGAGVDMFGYFDCGLDWRVDATKRAKIVSPSSPAVKAVQLAAPARVESFEIEAPKGTAASPSSIGVLLNGSKVHILNSTVTARDAVDGADGVQAVQLTSSNDTVGEANVKAALCSGGGNPLVCKAFHSGGSGGTNVCQGASGFAGGPGGKGGYGGRYTKSGTSLLGVELPTFGQLEVATAETAAGGSILTGARGQDGAKGANGTNGTSSAGGVFSATGFAPGDGTAGTNGAPGQGGGGGSGHDPTAAEANQDGIWFGHSGAGGGAGGCPGLAGTPGKGGGASVGILSWQSELRLEATPVAAGKGGSGGRGSHGTTFTSGAAPGANNVSIFYNDCSGGKGGDGGSSGWSGHGAGGPSVGVAYKGTAPQIFGATPVANVPGNGRAYEAPIHANKTGIVASPAGAAASVHAIP